MPRNSLFVISRLARPARASFFAKKLFLAGLSAVALLAAPPAQSIKPLDPPKGLTLCFVNVQWGDATIVIGPTGRCLVFDGGGNGMGTQAVIPWLRKLGVKRIDHAIASHYHSDHIGGLDEVIYGMPTTNVWDRGTRNTKGYAGSYSSYVRAAGTRRKTISVGQVFDLGGGATVKCYCSDGLVLGSSTRHKIFGTTNYENSASIVLKVEYGDFSCWLGGDLTGAGGRYDMETPVSRVFGDCDVYLANHHGWADSSNSNLMKALDPEVCVISCSHRNTHNVPHRTTLDRMTTPARSRLLIGTTAGAGEIGFTVGGTTVITSDGWRYRVTSQKGHVLDLYTDEFKGNAPRLGELVISEFHRRPKQYWGEYIEVANISGRALNLRGTELSTKNGRVTLHAPYRLLPGGKLIVAAHGDPSRNGALPFPHSIPGRAYSLHDSDDELRSEAQLPDARHRAVLGQLSGHACASRRARGPAQGSACQQLQERDAALRSSRLRDPEPGQRSQRDALWAAGRRRSAATICTWRWGTPLLSRRSQPPGVDHLPWTRIGDHAEHSRGLDDNSAASRRALQPR